MSSVVFDNDKYDATNFQQQSNLITGGRIYVTTKPTKPITPDVFPNNSITYNGKKYYRWAKGNKDYMKRKQRYLLS